MDRRDFIKTAGGIFIAETLGSCFSAPEAKGEIDNSYNVTHMYVGPGFSSVQLYGERTAGSKTEYVWLEGNDQGFASMKVKARTGRVTGGYTFVNPRNVPGNVLFVDVPVNLTATNAPRNQQCMYQDNGRTYAGISYNGSVAVSVAEGASTTSDISRRVSLMQRYVDNITMDKAYRPTVVEVGTVEWDAFNRKQFVPSPTARYCS